MNIRGEVAVLNEIFKALYGIIGLLLLAIVGGIVSVLQQTVILKNREFTWTFAFSEILISGFAGIIMYFICEACNVPQPAEAAAVGIAGNMGSKFVFATHRLLCNYLKCNKEDNMG